MDGARIVNTTTHNFTASGNFTQNGIAISYSSYQRHVTNHVPLAHSASLPYGHILAL